VVHPASPIRLYTDRRRLAHAMGILLERAVGSTPTGEVRVEAAADGGKAVIRVIDGGAALSPEQLAHLFDDLSRRPDRGKDTSLPLAFLVARKLLDGLEARIAAHGLPGKGLAIEITLPSGALPGSAGDREETGAGASASSWMRGRDRGP
jgi:signal transduction histidine kinase